MILTVACVLRTGARVVDRQPYQVAHVTKLRNAVSRWLDRPHRFRCLTDQVAAVEAAGVVAVPLQADWPGWWSKINLFAPGLMTGPTLYFDLDTLITGPLEPLVREDRGITMTADFGRPSMMNSSTMAWAGDASAIWNAMRRNAKAIIGEYDARHGPGVGDQGFIHDTLDGLGQSIDTFDPRHVVSFKMHARQGKPEDARVISFHGRPKVDTPEAGWAFKEWSAL